MTARRRKSASRRRSLTPEEELAAIKARAAGLRMLIKAKHHFSPDAVRKHRHRLGVTATQYGQLLGVSMQAVYGWEKGRSRPQPHVLLRWVELTRTPDKDALARLGLDEVQPISARQLKAERKRLGLSQAGYAALLGLHPSAISAWERGEAKPGRETLVKLRATRGMSKAAAQRRLARGGPVRVMRPRRKGSAPARRFPKSEHRLSHHPERVLAAIEKRTIELRDLIKAERKFSPEAVRRHRQSVGLSATRSGDLLGVHMQCIYGWEHGRFRPKPELLRRWTRLTRMSKSQGWSREAPRGRPALGARRPT